MKKIFITGATDGIGKLTAQMLSKEGHHMLVHGRSETKLETLAAELRSVGEGTVQTYCADLSDLAEVRNLASQIREQHALLDVLINNAGVLKTDSPITRDGLDVRFVVNTIAPYLLTKELLKVMGDRGRIVNLSSAAQAPVNLQALRGQTRLDALPAYSQSKLALTMWTSSLAEQLKPAGVVAVSVNPGSLLATKMVTEGFGVPGRDLQVGADVLCRAALSDEFATAHGRYFDNDAGEFADPHRDGLDQAKRNQLIRALDELIG